MKRLHLHLVTVAILSLSSKNVVHGSVVNCSEGDVRLGGGRNMYEGRVEMCDQGEWKSVCDLRWDSEEAEVVCRQLGYIYTEESNPAFLRRSCAGQGSGDIVEVGWECRGNETRLQDCNMTQPNRTCNHRTEAGVYCSGVTADNCTRGSIRLVNGSNNESGRVEICRRGCWGTVCDKGWDRNDATVVCRELGIDTERTIPKKGAYFGEGSGPIHLTQVECENNELKLIGCSGDKDGISDCVHSQDAGVICRGTSTCEDGDIQLTGGQNESEGRVEICYNGVWGTVCADDWDEVAGNLVCTQLGYGQSAVFLNNIKLGNTPILFEKAECNSSHINILQCLDLQNIGIGIHNCQQDSIAAVSCNGILDITATISVVAVTTHVTLQTTEENTASNPLPTTRRMADTTTEGSTTTTTASSSSLSLILGSTIGLVAIVGTIAVVSVILPLAAVLLRRKNKQEDDVCDGKDAVAWDNPTYEGHVTSNNAEDEKEFENPLYTDVDVDPSPTSNSTQNQPTQNNTIYEGLYSDPNTATSETVDDSGIRDGNGINFKITNSTEQEKSNGAVTILGAITVDPVVHDLLPDADSVDNSNDYSYSELGPSYSQLEPHIQKTVQVVHAPPNDEEYSCLQHK